MDSSPRTPLGGEPRFRDTCAPAWMYPAVFRLGDEPRDSRIHDLKPRFVPVLYAARESPGHVRRGVPRLDRVTERLLGCRIAHDEHPIHFVVADRPFAGIGRPTSTGMP